MSAQPPASQPVYTNIPELEIRLLYAMAVAGKSAQMVDSAIRRLLGKLRAGETAFQCVRRLVKEKALDQALREARIGNYGKLTRGFAEAAESSLDLALCPPDQLEKIHGIGPKTARFFIIWTRPQARYAALDTHVLKYLRYLGFNAPEATPSDPKRYAALEKAFLAEADKRGMSPRELDAQIWDWCKDRRQVNGEWPAALRRRDAA